MSSRDFPIGCTLDRDRFVITSALRGNANRGMYRARDRQTNRSVLVTLGPPQNKTIAELTRTFGFDVECIAALRHIGPLENEIGETNIGLVEDEPRGVPASTALALPIDPVHAARLGLEIARIIASAHERRITLCGLRPELIYIDDDRVTAIVPRCEPFLTTSQSRGAAPCFDDFYMAPETLAQPLNPALPSVDVFSLSAVLAHWVSGAHPFEGEHAQQVIAIMMNRRRAWRGDAIMRIVVDAGLAVSDRVTLDKLAELLELVLNPTTEP